MRGRPPDVDKILVVMAHKKDVVLITGASRGLGLEIARLFARRSTPIVLVARGAPALEAAAAELGRLTEVLALPADVGENAERIVAAGLERFGRRDGLVNKAAPIGP